MSYEVELSFRAEKDLDRILAWISDRSPQGARSWLGRWKEVREFLSERPESCLLAPENEDHEEEIRHIVFKTRSGRKYRALFVIRGQRVYVTNFVDRGKILFHRKKCLVRTIDHRPDPKCRKWRRRRTSRALRKRPLRGSE